MFCQILAFSHSVYGIGRVRLDWPQSGRNRTPGVLDQSAPLMRHSGRPIHSGTVLCGKFRLVNIKSARVVTEARASSREPQEAPMHRMASVGFLPLVFLAACARLGLGPSQSPSGAAAVEAPRTSEAIATPAPPPAKPAAPQVASTPGVQPVPASPAPAAGVAQASSGAIIPPSTSKAASPSGSSGGAAQGPAKPSRAGHPVPAPGGKERTAPPEKPATVASQQPAAQPTLDLAALEDRLRNTRAIGVFTKLTLKNNVDDLLAAFRAFYNGQIRTTLAELRQRYDILVMKVLTLVQDGDSALAQEISASRDSIWGILSDREKFQKFSLH